MDGKIIQGLTEAVAIAKGEEPAAVLRWHGHDYVPMSALETAERQLAETLAALSGAAYVALVDGSREFERTWFGVGWRGGPSKPNNDEQAALYERGRQARIVLEPREPTEADQWCDHFVRTALRPASPEV